MISESLLALSLKTSIPNLPTHSNLMGATTIARSYGGGGFRSSSFSGSSFRSSGSSFRSSSSFSSRPSSFSSRPSSFSRPSSTTIRSTSPTISAPIKAPSISTPSTKTSTPSVVRVNKQSSTSGPSLRSTSSSVPIRTAPNVVTRETYVNHYDSGIAGNPWFWMYMFNNNDNNRSTSAPTQVIVRDSEGDKVTVPSSQMIVKKYSYNPLREFLVFSLGGGIGVLIGRKFSI